MENFFDRLWDFSGQNCEDNNMASKASGKATSLPASTPRVHFKKGDITKLKADCIVSSNNTQLKSIKGISKAICNAAGSQLGKACSSFIEAGNILHISEVFVSPAGGTLHASKVLHTVGPVWKYYNGDEASCGQDLRRCILACLVTVHRLKMKSIALPFIGCGITQVPPDTCARGYVNGVAVFEYLYENKILTPSLTDIYFVDINQENVKSFERQFFLGSISISEEEWDSDIKFALHLLNQVSIPPLRPNETSTSLERQSVGRLSYGSNTRERNSFGTDGDREAHHRAIAQEGNMRNVQAQSKISEGSSHVSDRDGKSGRDRERQSSVCDDISRNWVSLAKTPTTRDNYDGTEMPQAGAMGQIEQKAAASQNPSIKVSHLHAGDIPSDLTIVIGCPFEKLMAPLNYESDSGSDCSGLGSERESGQSVFFNLICLPLEEKSAKGIEKSLENLPDALSSYQRRMDISRPQSVVITSSLLFEDGDEQLVSLFGRCLQEQLIGAMLIDVTISTHEGFLPVLKSVLVPQSLTNTNERDEDPSLGYDEECSKQGNHKFPCRICTYDWDGSEQAVLECCGYYLCQTCRSKIQRCPNCYQPFENFTGDQPDGEMTCCLLDQRVPGDSTCKGSIKIHYHFSGGVQSAEHVNPGQIYHGTTREAYLPYSKEGMKVLKLLRLSFLRRLTFTVGKSSKTGRDNVIVWNDIHHKTTLTGEAYGYPDATYLSRVQRELSEKGVKLTNMTEDEELQVEEFCNQLIRPDARR